LEGSVRSYKSDKENDEMGEECLYNGQDMKEIRKEYRVKEGRR
jgi:hypothetical protein